MQHDRRELYGRLLLSGREETQGGSVGRLGMAGLSMTKAPSGAVALGVVNRLGLLMTIRGMKFAAER